MRAAALMALACMAMPASAQDLTMREFTQYAVSYQSTDGFANPFNALDATIARDADGKTFGCFRADMDSGFAKRLIQFSARGEVVNGTVLLEDAVPGLDCWDADAIRAANSAGKLATALTRLGPEGYNEFMAVTTDGRGWLWTQPATCSSWAPDCGPVEPTLP
ncbi:MAG: DUF6446 family protein [Pseudomonadota bacterium]